MRKAIAILLVSLAPAALLLGGLQDRLLSARILNTKDLQGVAGMEHGSVADYLLNVWCWDGALLLLWIMAVPSFFCGLWLLSRGHSQAGGA